MEKLNDYEKLKEKGITNFGLAGRVLNSNTISKLSLKPGYAYIREEMWKNDIEDLIKNAKNDKDLDAIGLKLNYAIDNKYDVSTIDYQFKAARKMTEIENKSEEYKVN